MNHIQTRLGRRPEIGFDCVQIGARGMISGDDIRATTPGFRARWSDGDLHHGRTWRCASPEGHRIELYFKPASTIPDAGASSRYKNMPPRRVHTISPSRLDHLNLLVSDVRTNRELYQTLLGMKLTEQIMDAEVVARVQPVDGAR